MIEIKLDPEGTSVTMKPVSFLGRDKFPLYRDALTPEDSDER